MARANLGALLGNVGEKQNPTPPIVEPAEIAVDPPWASPSAAGAARSSTATPPAPRKNGSPLAPPTGGHAATYLHYVRKETRLRQDQQNQLTLEARRLNRAKKSRAARITENSLIRVAVDLLLARIGDAAGDDEDAIRKSLTS